MGSTLDMLAKLGNSESESSVDQHDAQVSASVLTHTPMQTAPDSDMPEVLRAALAPSLSRKLNPGK